MGHNHDINFIVFGSHLWFPVKLKGSLILNTEMKVAKQIVNLKLNL